MSEKPNWPPELVRRASDLLAEQLKAGKTITSLDFKTALRHAVGLSYKVVQEDVSKFLRASMMSDGRCGHGYKADASAGYIKYEPATLRVPQPIDSDTSLGRFSLLLAKLYAVRSQEGLETLELKLRMLQAGYNMRELEGGAEQNIKASSDLATQMYDRLDKLAKSLEETGPSEDLLLVLKKRYAVWGLIEPENKRAIQQKIDGATANIKQAPIQAKTETSLAHTVLGCLAAAAAISVAPKLFQKTSVVVEEVAK